MSFPNKNQSLRVKITDFHVAKMCSTALRKEHANDTSNIKNIEAKTNLIQHTISKWYRASNTPKSAHLLILASIYPEVLKGLLFMIGRGDVWRYCLLNNIPEKMELPVKAQTEINTIYSDKFVHLDVILNREVVVRINQRQLWFISELQNGRYIGAAEITLFWKTTLRTSRRDIQEILQMGIIEYCGARKNGHYR